MVDALFPSCPKLVVGHLTGKNCKDSRQQPAGMTVIDMFKKYGLRVYYNKRS